MTATPQTTSRLDSAYARKLSSRVMPIEAYPQCMAISLFSWNPAPRQITMPSSRKTRFTGVNAGITFAFNSGVPSRQKLRTLRFSPVR